MAYTDAHRMFIQSFISKGVMNTRDVKACYAQCKNRISEPINEETMNEEIPEFVRTINYAISSFNLEIKKGIQEHDGSSVYCLVNTVESPISRLSSTYSQNELELFKKLVEQIIESDDGLIGSRIALNTTERLEKRMGKEEAQNFLNSLEKEKWIIKDENGKISLSVRSLLELDQYLQEMYPDLVKKCYMCSKLCIRGDSCMSCGIRVHLKCAKTFFSKQTDKKCPSCRLPWNSSSPGPSTSTSS